MVIDLEFAANVGNVLKNDAFYIEMQLLTA